MKTIFVPSDFSKNADTALRYAIRLGAGVKARLVVFHCAHISPYILAAASASEQQLNTLIEEDVNYKTEKLKLQVKKAFSSLGAGSVPKGTKIIVESNPLVVENILEAAVACKADLIVTGTHGATGLNRFFFGSHTASLIAKSPVPVLAVPGKHRYSKVKRIAFSSDLEDLGNELKQLIPFARLLKADIDVVYFNYGTDISGSDVKTAVTVINKCNYRKVKFVERKAKIEFSLIRQLRSFLEKDRHQWLVMFTRERSFWNKLIFGGKTEHMSYSMKIPLLSFKKASA